jgi:ABC-type multidrug transport system ATPase subunit
VGPSGSGKSTIISLIERYYEINSGEIILDRLKIKEFNKFYLRSLIGYVPQEPMLFNRSIRENILIGRENICEEQILKACEMANVNQFLPNLENGLDTLVGVKGSKFSGGQKQRIAIARAILGNPKILIFDEATSALDVNSEREVQMAIDLISKHITTIVIAHRLSTIKRADNIIVLEKGKVVETGTHETLINKQGYYSQLILNKIYEKDAGEIDSFNHQDQQRKSSCSLGSLNSMVLTQNSGNRFILQSQSEKFTLRKELEDDNKKLEKNRKFIFDLVFQKKLLVSLAIVSSFLLGICYPIIGLLIAAFLDMLATTPTDQTVKNGLLFTLYFFILGIACGALIYLQKYLYILII